MVCKSKRKRQEVEYEEEKIKAMRENNLVKLGKYRHFKGTKVRVICEALHSETKESFVVYTHLEDNINWVRPKTMFLEEVEVDNQKVPRFEYIGD